MNAEDAVQAVSALDASFSPDRWQNTAAAFPQLVLADGWTFFREPLLKHAQQSCLICCGDIAG